MFIAGKSKKEEALRLRLSGLTYQQIAEQLHVSRQRIQQLVRPPAAIYHLIRNQAKDVCQKCGINVQNGHVHHIKSQELDCSIYNDLINLQYLCISCHRISHSVPKSDMDATDVSITMEEAGRLGGTARAKALTPEQRIDIARKAGKQRWRKKHEEDTRAKVLGEGG